MRKDGQTDTTKLIVALRNFANAPKTNDLDDNIYIMIVLKTCIRRKELPFD